MAHSSIVFAVKPSPRRQGVDVGVSVFSLVLLAVGIFQVITGEHVIEQVSGGLGMLTAGLLGVPAGLRVRARALARRQRTVVRSVDS
jgi:hypothetical protein